MKTVLTYSCFGRNVCFIFLMILVSSCQTDKKKFVDTPKHYMAINDRDTAHLRIVEEESEFHGSYEIIYGRSGKDTGVVSGKVVKDTLSGIFTYKPFGGGYEKTVPFAVLKKDNMLFLGRGIATSYLNIHYYTPNVPIDYSDSKFMFKEVINSNNK